MDCPICDCSYSDQFKYINCESFDNSYLYKDILVRKCNSCGHIYNELNGRELHDLTRYYIEEYAPSNLSSNDKEGDKPGSDNRRNIYRYEHVLGSLAYHIKKDSRVLDVGCAMGGFLNYLEDKCYENLYGIDMIKGYVDKADNENIKLGSVYLLPFEDNSFDIIILDQVLEHLSNLKLALKEIRRVLDKGGICYIGVPDVERYDDIYFYLMREHIQHFNVVGIKLLAQRNGFELINVYLNEPKMIGGLNLPNISATLKVSSSKIYCWGIGREFMYLYKNTRLKNLDLILVDDTPYKQKQTFKGMKIYSSDILKEADEYSSLIITARVHKDKLTRKAKELGFKGEIIDV